MLNENIRTLRKARGLSQEELAVKLNVVRQTVSKWEQGLSVPDADTLIAIADAFETNVSTLLGENVREPEADGLKALSEKLEVVNLQLAKMKEARRKKYRVLFIALCAATVIVFLILLFMQSPYLNWDYEDPETAAAGTILHGFEFVFVRIAPFILIGSAAGIILTRKK